jgi:RecD/TraA family predicted helicase
MAININYAAYGIKLSEHQHKLDKHYDGDLKRFREDIKTNPYHVLIGICGMSFKYADTIIMRFKHIAPDAYCRCQYAVYDVLKSNELAGNTRITDAQLAEGIYRLASETMRHVVTVVCGDPLIHYEPKRHLVAFEQTYKDELLIADHLLERVKHGTSAVQHDLSKYQKEDNINLTDEQMSALHMVLQNDVCMINGSAGSGKSQTTKSIVNMLDDMDMNYQLLASTGIASKVLRGYTGRSAMTIHMFLTGAWQPDYIIVDESSMVSVHLLAALLGQVGYEPKLVFIADNAQLASIQCGSLVQDMIDSGIIPRVELTKIFRYNSSGIVTIATDVRHGNCDHLGDDFPDYLFAPEDENNPIGQVVEQYDRLIADGYGVDDIVVLCPFNKRVGSDAINAAISEKYNPNKPVRKNSVLKLGDKVLNTKNDYSGGIDDMIANGDIGYLRSVAYDGKAKTSNVMVEFDDGIKDVKSLTQLKQAYSMSIHKCQGSSAKAVIVLIDPMHGFMCSRNLLYTAVTRARERLIIICDADTIKNAVQIEEQATRHTWLKELLTC